jgi:hypothetical protein
MEDLSKMHFEPMHIFNNIKLKSYIGTELTNNNNIFICGKMNEHTTQAKYSFRACEFLIYLPFDQKLFYSEMISDDCFTSTLKWNYNFFKKIRMCLESADNIKNTYFSIEYDKKAPQLNTQSGGNKSIIIDINIVNPPASDPLSDDIELDFADRKLYFELHFVVEGQDITALRLLLNHMIDDKPYFTMLNKALEYDKIESERMSQKQQKLFDKEKEILKMENEIKEIEDNFSNKKIEYVNKFYYLNKEKNYKITELNNELKKKLK